MQTYSFATSSLSINNVEVTGYDEGDDVITMRRLNDNSSHIISADGVMTVSFSPDRSGEIIFRVNQASDINALLCELVTNQEQNVLVPIAVDFKDFQNDDNVLSTTGYIPRPADMVRGLNTQSQEWRIVVENLTMIHKGGVYATVGA